MNNNSGMGSFKKYVEGYRQRVFDDSIRQSSNMRDVIFG
jgi:hypothetical protein